MKYHSRSCLNLTVLKDRTSLALLRQLLDAIECFGKPEILKTDNEAVFTCKLFRCFLDRLGIRHQLNRLGCTWDNGRIERFFGSLKGKLDRWEVSCREELSEALGQFRFWYNWVRPHRNLGGRTPAEVWSGKDIFVRPAGEQHWFEAWDGLLRGIYLRF